MKVTILYKPNSETETRVEEYVRDFQRRTGHNLNLLDAESREGIELAKIHDILAFPAILVTEEDSAFVQAWTEIDKWPTISELSLYNQ